MPILSCLSDRELLSMSEAVVEEVLGDGALVTRQGEEGCTLFVLCEVSDLFKPDLLLLFRSLIYFFKILSNFCRAGQW